ncbi:MAG: MMPL family transporter, partial [Spirillospora sp.]
MPANAPTTPSPPLLRRLGAFTVRRRRWVLITGLIVLVAVGMVGSGAMNALTLSRFESPGSESVRADGILERRLQTGHSTMFLLVTVQD